MPKWWNPPHWHYTGVMVATRINFLFPFFIFSQVHCHHQWQTQNPSLSTPPMATPKKKKISTKRKSNHQLHPQKEKISNHQYHHQPHKPTSITAQASNHNYKHRKPKHTNTKSSDRWSKIANLNQQTQKTQTQIQT